MSSSPEHNAERHDAVPSGDAAEPVPHGSEAPREEQGHPGEPVEEEAAPAPPSMSGAGPDAGPDLEGNTAATADESSMAFDIPRFDESGRAGVDARRVTLLNDVRLRVKIELGRTRMLVEDVLRLADGSVVELDKLAGDPVDVYVNDRLVARGEVLVLNDNFCVRVSEVISRDPHRISA